MVKISIIVPVYNCAPYLSRCLDSLLAQTLPDLQIILVDDGSTDGSGTICNQYAGKDQRITVIHQKNAGVSAARNAGLDIAAGAYIGFVDADDWVAPHMFSALYENAHATNAQIVMCDAITAWEDGRQEPDTIPLLTENRVLAKSDIFPELLRLMAGSACRCLYRANLLSGYQIRFPENLKFSEDRIFNLQAMGIADTISYLKQGFYFRFIRPGSATTSIHTDLFTVQHRAYLRAEELLLAHWGEAYLPIYQKMLIIDGALMQIYQICDSKSPRKLEAIRCTIQHPALSEAFSCCSPKGLREWMLVRKQSVLLYMTGILWNIKHRIQG